MRASGYLNGLSSWAIGENIAYGSGSYANAAKIVQMWMEPPGHRANILSGRFRAIGVGIVIGTPRGSEGATYTTNFGSEVRSGAPAGSAAQSSPPPATSHHRKVKKKQREAARLTRRSCRRVLRSRRAKRAQKRRCARYLRRQRAHRRKR